MEWVDELFQLIGLWGFITSAVAVGAEIGVEYALKHTIFTVRK